jgi:hypothetical protein
MSRPDAGVVRPKAKEVHAARAWRPIKIHLVRRTGPGRADPRRAQSRARRAKGSATTHLVTAPCRSRRPRWQPAGRLASRAAAPKGSALAPFLVTAGFSAPACRRSSPAGLGSRAARPGKSDPGDALTTAPGPSARAGLPPVRLADRTRELGLLLDGRDALVMRPHTGPIASVRRGGLIGSPPLPAATPGSLEAPRQVRLGIRDDGQFSRDRR